jgi:hypothetical protein
MIDYCDHNIPRKDCLICSPPPEQPSLFDAPTHRNIDNRFSREAGEAIKPKIGVIQWAVIAAYRAHGPMRARDCETLPELDKRQRGKWGYSTVRKRISELGQAGILEYVPGGGDTYQLNEERVLDPLPPEELEVCPTCHRTIPPPSKEPDDV